MKSGGKNFRYWFNRVRGMLVIQSCSAFNVNANSLRSEKNNMLNSTFYFSCRMTHLKQVSKVYKSTYAQIPGCGMKNTL